MSDNAKHKQIFIAYASKDQAAHDILLSHLNVLQKEIPITIWSKADLLGGAETQKETQAELQRADIVLLLISTDLLNSETYANIQSQQLSATFVPVLVRPCTWKSDPFLKDLQPLPKNKQFISSENNQEKVYTEITKDIKKMVVGKADDIPFVPPVNESPFWKKSVLISLIAVLTLAGAWGISSLLSSEDKPPVEITEDDLPTISATFNPTYGTPIFTTDTSLFKILIIRFEPNVNRGDDTYCIGRSIEESFIQLKRKGLPIHPIYKDSIPSPKYPEEAERIQQHHNADILIYGLANEIQENCTAANVCFRHVVANTIMANLGILKDKRIKHDAEYERMSHRDIEKGKLSVDEQSMEAWVTGLVALKKDDKETYFEEIEKMAVDITHLTKEEQVSKFNDQGCVYILSEDYGKAVASYTKSIELNPYGAKAYNRRGNSYASLNAYQEAILDYTIAIELRPDYAYTYSRRGYTYYALEEYEKAILDYTKAIELDSVNAVSYNNRGYTYYYLDEYKKATLDYTKAIELNPDDATNYIDRGDVYFDLNEYEKAILDYTKAIELDSANATYYNNRGYAYFDLNEYEKAILDYTKAIELNPDDAYFYHARGEIYYEIKGYEEAILDLERSIELQPDNVDFYICLGTKAIYLRKYRKAIINSKKGIELGNKWPSYPNLIAAYIFKNLILIIFSLIFIIGLLIGWRKYRKSKK